MQELKQKWQSQGENYAQAVNEMVAFAEEHGWENWKGKEPEDKRQDIAPEVFSLLKKANQENQVEAFRENFPPAFLPFAEMLEEKTQTISQICFISEKKVVFLVGSPYAETKKAYLLDDTTISPLNESFKTIGKAKKGEVFALYQGDSIITTQGFQGETIAELPLEKAKNADVNQIIPFNDGKKVLLVSYQGIFLISSEEEKRLDTIANEDTEQYDENYDIDMAHADLSHDNRYIALGEQCSNHCILSADGELLNEFYPESSYPHFSLFSSDDRQVIFNSCHFYNGVTGSVSMERLEEHQEASEIEIVEEEMRVYTGLSVEDHYILGDAYGYIRAVNTQGQLLWRHFLGGNMASMAISDDGKTLWVGTYSGFLFRLSLGKGQRDRHTIGTSNHYEDFRWLVFKDEEQIWRW